MAIVQNKGNAFEPVDHHWHADANEVHGSGGDGIPGASGSDLITANDPVAVPEADKTQSLAAWIDSLTPKLFWKVTTTLDMNDSQFIPGGTFCSYLDFMTYDTEAHLTQSRATAAFARHTQGSTLNGPATGDYASFHVGRKIDYLTSTVEGEVGALYAVAWQGKYGDVSALLGEAVKYMPAGDHTGGAVAIEVGAREVNAAGNTIRLTKGLTGFREGGTTGSLTGGSASFWAESQVGHARALYYGGSLNPATFDYALLFGKNRDPALQFFAVDDDGVIIQGLAAARRTIGMNGTTWEVKNTAGSVIHSQADTGSTINYGKHRIEGSYVTHESRNTAVAIGAGGLWRWGIDASGQMSWQINSAGAGDFSSAVAGPTISTNGALVLPAPLYVQDATESASPVTGSALFYGGVGIAKALNVGGKVNASAAGLNTKQAVNNVHDTAPTAAELTAAFGTPASLGRGFIGTVDDADGNLINYICWTSDASWYFLKGTKAA